MEQVQGGLAKVGEHLALYGHRNWIVVADAAYPVQSRPGIRTVCWRDDDPLEVLRQVLEEIDDSRHVRPVIHVDRELQFVSEDDAPGVTAYRESLAILLKRRTSKPMPHEEIIALLDQAAQMFKVLIVKTTMTIPYTSVFIQLDCGYWSAEAESRLRAAIGETAG
jgi:hypothetical protein